MVTETFDALSVPDQFSDVVGPVAGATPAEFQKSIGIAEQVRLRHDARLAREAELKTGADRGIRHDADGPEGLAA